MESKDIYNYSYDYLIKLVEGRVEKDKIDEFISVPDASKCSSLADAFEMM